ncbi:MULTISPECIES: helix-turn-helix domain-containing protein [Flavobacteriaceae]|uniref:helix-turn-helix domain-containing protein n=1 Tax=Flavobacteriaceae TaxID=49546 RepID=UPI00234BDEF5|nr:AraC family transcriptional regulator [Muricauda sp. SP22]MDC6361811.1 AraC family transcriptional regulator [Muricauda sp. SP22]
MQSVLKSELFKGSVYKKKYSKDFLTEELLEDKIEIDTSDVSGVIKELQLNGIFIWSKYIHAPKGYVFQVSSNFSLFALHFEIAGNYRYTPFKDRNPLVEIPDFHYNIFYLPEVNGTLEYKGAPRRTLEIVFTLGLIKELVGDTYGQTLEKIDDMVRKGKPFVFWKKPRPISSELGQVLEEIINCPFAGRLKKTYLQSKITTLLVDILIEFNGNLKPEPNIKVSKTDIASIRRVERHIKSNLKKTLPISELSTIAGFNGTKLKRDFKRIHGTTIYKYITRLRMKKASALIRNEGLTIAQAAYEVGYGNPQHFTNAFKRTMGYLPSSLKK